jgi:hypothetical protein
MSLWKKRYMKNVKICVNRRKKNIYSTAETGGEF